MFLNKLITENKKYIEENLKLKEDGRIIEINMPNLIPSFYNSLVDSFCIVYNGEFNVESKKFEDILAHLFNSFKLYENDLDIRITDEIIEKMERFRKKSFEEILENNSSNISKYFSTIAKEYKKELFEQILEFFYIIMKYIKLIQENKIEDKEEKCKKLKNFKEILENLKEKIQKNEDYKGTEIIIKHIEFYILNIEEYMFLFGERNFDDKNIELINIREKILKWILKNKYYESLSPKYFLSTPLRLEIFFYLKTILKMTVIVDTIYSDNRKKFYGEFLEKDEKGKVRDLKNRAIIGNGYLNGYRQVSLTVINKFVNKYKNDKKIKEYNINELYFDYLKSNQIYSLISLDYSYEKIFGYETEVLYKNNFISQDSKNYKYPRPYFENYMEDENLQEYEDNFSSRTKVKVKIDNDRRLNISGTYFIRLNMENIRQNLEKFKRLIKNTDEKILVEKFYLEKKYLDYNSFLGLEKDRVFLHAKMTVTCMDIRENGNEIFYILQFKKSFNFRREYFDIILKENDFEFIGEVLEEKIIYKKF